MKLLLFFLSLAACVTNICTAQKIIITGSVKDTNNIKIIGATITLHTKQNNTVIAYSYTNSTGNYEIVFPEKFLHQSCIIKATALNFDIAIKDLDYSNNNFFYNFILKPSFKNLSEVIVQSKLPISIKKDTLKL
jgi:hypothetical protein